MIARLSLVAGAAVAIPCAVVAQNSGQHEAPRLTGLKAEAAAAVDERQELTQEIVDSLFSFSELGFQEFETQRYLTQLLERNGFDVETRRLGHAVVVVGVLGER